MPTRTVTPALGRRLLAALLIVLLCGGALAACGDDGEDRRGRLETSLTDALDRALDAEGSFATVVSADCDGGGTRMRCSLGLTTGVDGAFEDSFRVTLGEDGCWRATRERLTAAGGLDAEQAPPKSLKGCLS